MAREHIRSWQVGDVKVSRIVEIWDFQDDIHMAMPDATPGEVKALDWLHPHYATPEGRMRMNFQAFVLQTPERTIVIDTCIGAGREREYEVFTDLPEGFLEDLASLGIEREDVDTVFCTHLHFDHVGWNTYKDRETGEYRPTFPNARYLFGKTEYEAWQNDLRHDDHHDDKHMIESVDPIVAAGLVDFIDTDHEIAPGIHAEPSHGHTPGHIHVVIESRGERAVITGDLMHHPMQCAMPHRHATFDMDREKGSATRQAFVDTYRDSGALVIGMHFCEPTAGHFVTASDGETWFRGLGIADR
ncbi:MBL fold metallo-hydrolase [Aurantiacibacter poecillastricola]|uniref:MBL fold metallo-hydrolase n=1 Tax=Aurantiacibacter poecillastricola TaxID=3064385 RepID=UPI0027402801|nr:MBL fold metallo-hydrolase [Aurantiacibacter sp. 219JJ12-13]MDP5260659.1 MBL fold metallo-hydrolase [Aurantiacibacter sp. 219JJ12-13]